MLPNVAMFVLAMIQITAAAAGVGLLMRLVPQGDAKWTTVGSTGQSWHLWCPTHGGHRGPILWGRGTPRVVPCPRCGEETPDTFTKGFE